MLKDMEFRSEMVAHVLLARAGVVILIELLYFSCFWKSCI